MTAEAEQAQIYDVLKGLASPTLARWLMCLIFTEDERLQNVSRSRRREVAKHRRKAYWVNLMQKDIHSGCSVASGRFSGWARILCIVTVIFICVIQPLDAAAHNASVSVSNGDRSVTALTLSAFDVVDDGLDHLPDRHRSTTEHQCSLVTIGCPDMIFGGRASIMSRAAHPHYKSRIPDSIANRLERPPRS